MFLLRQRRPARWGEADAYAALRPGHPVYERLRAEWLARDAEDEEEIIASINAKLDAMQARERAVHAMLAAPEGAEEDA